MSCPHCGGKAIRACPKCGLKYCQNCGKTAQIPLEHTDCPEKETKQGMDCASCGEDA